jgi:molybdopterin converting factor small subunit
LLVSVGFLGLLRDQLGQKSLSVELPDGAGFDDLLDVIAPVLQDKLGAWAWDREKGRFSPRVVVLRETALGKADPSAPLTDGEQITVFPPLAGG